MITSKELKYVDNWASKIPMPGVEYSKAVLEEIRKCYETFNKKYKDKEYSMIFSDSEEIEFEIQDKNLCHMLGIDYSNIKGSFFDNYRLDVFNVGTSNFKSYDLIEMILSNADKVAEYDNDPNNRAKAINYYKSAIKCAIFNKLMDFEKFNFGVINYVGDKEDVDYKKQKLFFIPSNEALTPYFMMTIKQDEEVDCQKYVVSSLSAPQTPKIYFDNQEVIIPTQILISDNDNLKKVEATAEEKIQLLTMYKSIINEYNIPCRINIYGDYESILNDLANKKYMLTR